MILKIERIVYAIVLVLILPVLFICSEKKSEENQPPSDTSVITQLTPDDDSTQESSQTTDDPVTTEAVKNTIIGLPEGLVVYEDDPIDVVLEMLLEGVYTVPNESNIKVRFFDPDGNLIPSLVAGECTVEYYGESESETESITLLLNVKPADVTPPTIKGASDKTVELGKTISYRDGVSATDNEDGSVRLNVDASRVDLTKPGTYSLIYSATDKRGNTSSITVKVTVVEPPKQNENNTNSNGCTKEELDALCTRILSKILREGMTEREKAEAIYNRVSSIRYVSTPDDPEWINAAYVGLTTGRGDCWNYASASKALLTLAGIPNYDIKRHGGTSSHFWQIVYVDDGWYHFDACPTLKKYYLRCFLLTEEEVIEYSEKCVEIPNYFIYDYDSCPYEVVKSRS